MLKKWVDGNLTKFNKCKCKDLYLGQTKSMYPSEWVTDRFVDKALVLVDRVDKKNQCVLMYGQVTGEHKDPPFS